MWRIVHTHTTIESEKTRKKAHKHTHTQIQSIKRKRETDSKLSSTRTVVKWNDRNVLSEWTTMIEHRWNHLKAVIMQKQHQTINTLWTRYTLPFALRQLTTKIRGDEMKKKTKTKGRCTIHTQRKLIESENRSCNSSSINNKWWKIYCWIETIIV